MGKKLKSKKQTELYLSILKKELLHLSSILPEDTGSVVVDNVVYTPPKKDVDFLKKLGI
jgi:ABC-type protease/lipase transport system fused ATPase/permease subunit